MMTAKIVCDRSDGKTFVIGREWGILDLSGLDAPEYTLYSEERASGTGSVVTGSSMSKRVIEVTAKVRRKYLHGDRAANARYRAAAAEFFNPAYTYRLTITYQDTTRWTDARLDGFKLPSGNIHDQTELTVSFLCPDPYLKSVDDFAKNIASVTPCSGFPFVSVGGGFPVSVRNFARSVAVLNNGDAPAGFRAVLIARGDVVNPKIIKGGKFVRLITTMHEGDTITIDLERKTITANGVDALSLIDRASSFTDMRFEVGDNTITYDADSGNNLLDVTLYYNTNYFGM